MKFSHQTALSVPVSKDVRVMDHSKCCPLQKYLALREVVRWDQLLDQSIWT